MKYTYTNKVIFENDDVEFSKMITDHITAFNMEVKNNKATVEINLRDSLQLNCNKIFTSLINIKDGGRVSPFLIRFVDNNTPVEKQTGGAALVFESNNLVSYNVSQGDQLLLEIIHHIVISTPDVTFGEYQQDVQNSQTDDN
jgi:hypothetical protein